MVRKNEFINKKKFLFINQDSIQQRKLIAFKMSERKVKIRSQIEEPTYKIHEKTKR